MHNKDFKKETGNTIDPVSEGSFESKKNINLPDDSLSLDLSDVASTEELSLLSLESSSEKSATAIGEAAEPPEKEPIFESDSLDLSDVASTEELSLLSLESSSEKSATAIGEAAEPPEKKTIFESDFTIDMPGVGALNLSETEITSSQPPQEDFVLELSGDEIEENTSLEEEQLGTQKTAGVESETDGLTLDFSDSSFQEQLSFKTESEAVTLDLSDMESDDTSGYHIAEEDLPKDDTLEKSTDSGYTVHLSGFSDDDYGGLFSEKETPLSRESLAAIDLLESNNPDFHISLEESDEKVKTSPVLETKKSEEETDASPSLGGGIETAVSEIPFISTTDQTVTETHKVDKGASTSLPVKEKIAVSKPKKKEQKIAAKKAVKKSSARSSRPAPKSEDILTEIAEQILKRVITGEKSDNGGLHDIFSFSEEEVLDLISPPLERLGLQLERTIGRFQTTRGANGYISNIYASGSISCQKSVAGHLNSQITNTEAEISHLPLSEKRDSKRFKEMCDLEKDTYLPAIGMALSNINETPNFLYTYKERLVEKVLKWAFRGTLLLCGIAMLSSGAWWYSKKAEIKENKVRIEAVQKQIKEIPKLLDQNAIGQLSGIRDSYRKNILNYAKKLLPSAVYKEVSDITPSYIKLIKVEIVGKSNKKVLIEGVIIDNDAVLESRLVEYLFSFGKSSFFQRPLIREKRIENFNGRRVLRFSIHSKIN